MCPKSHRDTLRAEGCCGYDKMRDEEYEALSVPMAYEVFMRHKTDESARWDEEVAHRAAQEANARRGAESLAAKRTPPSAPKAASRARVKARTCA